MPFGGFAPLPLRLGGSSQEGWSPEQHARLSSDIAALKRVCPIAVLTYDQPGGFVAIRSYHGVNGNTASVFPLATVLGTGVAKFVFPASITDSYGIERAVNISHGTGSAELGDITAQVLSPNIVVARMWSLTGVLYDGKGTLAVW